MFRNFIAAVVLVLGVGFAHVVEAAIIDNGSYTTDTVQGIDFLDLQGLPANPYSYYSNGYEFDGSTWTLATIEQVSQLWLSFEPLAWNFNEGSTNVLNSNAGALLDLIGITRSGIEDNGVEFNAALGWVLDTNLGDDWNTDAQVIDYFGISEFDSFAPGIAPLGWSRDYQTAWLVRESIAVVPLPPSAILFGSALFGLGAMRRRRRAV